MKKFLSGIWRRKWLAIAVCAILLTQYAVMAWLAVSRQSATYDETLSVVSAYAATELHDYRLDFEHPPLWKYWAWLPNFASGFDVDEHSLDWLRVTSDPMLKWDIAVKSLYQWNGSPHQVIARSRAMMLILSIGLGASIAFMASRIGGRWAAVIATALFSFDPDFLAHGPLVKNDVAISVLSVWIVYLSVWAGRRSSWRRLLLLGLVLGAALLVKMTAILLVLVSPVLVLTAIMHSRPTPKSPFPWLRLLASVSLVMATAYATLWAGYGFRYRPAPDESVHIKLSEVLRMTALRDFYQRDPARHPTEEEIAQWISREAVIPGIVTRWKLLPEPWVAAILWTRRTAAGEKSYFFGRVYPNGQFWYFPVAVALKTPLATLVLFAICAGGSAMWLSRQSRLRHILNRWQGILSYSFISCALVFLFAAEVGKVNLGIRYLLPMYALVYILIGNVAARIVHKASLGIRAIVLMLLVVLAAESLAAFPHYLSHFNPLAGGVRGGFHILGDSNLDWGQDLPLLAKWQQRHRGEKLYLCYFGTEDPASWGIQYTNLPGGYAWGPPPQDLSSPGWIAISATNLQGIYFTQDLYATWRDKKPVEVLGGSIYVYRYPSE